MCLTNEQTKLIRKLLGRMDITALDADEFRIASELYETLKPATETLAGPPSLSGGEEISHGCH
jgi:hypothetical protein